MQDRHTTHTHSHRLEWRHPVGPLGIHNECAKDPQREQPGTLNHNLEESHLLKNTLISTRMRKRLLLTRPRPRPTPRMSSDPETPAAVTGPIEVLEKPRNSQNPETDKVTPLSLPSPLRSACGGPY